MMPTFYANSVLIHLNDTGEISHEIGEEVFMSEMIKIIQGGQTASLMETWLMVWDYECSPNSIYIVCLTPSHYLCQWLLFLAPGRAVQLVRGSPAPMSAPWRSLSLLRLWDALQGYATGKCLSSHKRDQSQLPHWCPCLMLSVGAGPPPAFLQMDHKPGWAFGKTCFQSQTTFLKVVSLQTFWTGAKPSLAWLNL